MHCNRKNPLRSRGFLGNTVESFTDDSFSIFCTVEYNGGTYLTIKGQDSAITVTHLHIFHFWCTLAWWIKIPIGGVM